jgi:serine/threonine protein kinase
LQRIERKSFVGCASLAYFHIPASITFIGAGAFPHIRQFDVESGNHENAVRAWCVRFGENARSTFDLTSLPVLPEWQNIFSQFDRFHHVKLIGHGYQGEVHLYKDNTSGESIAVKSSRLKDCVIVDGIIDKIFVREVQSLKKFDHPCIVPLLGYDLDMESKILRIAMPYLGRDSLGSVLESPEKHPWLTTTSKTIIIVGIVIGMYFVHCGRIIHRDLKPANILLDPTSHCPKIADFGFSREEDPKTTMSGGKGSPLYMAPEVMNAQRYSNKADVFSFGVLLYEMVTGRQPNQDCGGSGFNFSVKVMSGSREKIPETVEPFTAGLISRCWAGDPDRRPTFQEIFDELQRNRFKVFSAVDSQAVERFLESLR